MKSILSRRNLTFGGITSLATLALLGKSERTEAAAPEHPNNERPQLDFSRISRIN